MSNTDSAPAALVTRSSLMVLAHKSAKVILATDLVPTETNSEKIYLAPLADQTRCFAPSVFEIVTSALGTHKVVPSSDQTALPTHETSLTIAETDGIASLVVDHVELVLMTNATP
ncbi:OLC1v1019294C1 [Oldenlandia corymbosa var. corymbosa]|uniref:OLC1v1019294C1 n=1 Tax=Oldenlandia corymbosa var. corymbosa TaxID=529605 RepID=A0AAV1EDQ5_OLDCO|nr:OLC1v1019294C1 [Oldenlandia corymbosa var. corymbosa]